MCGLRLGLRLYRLSKGQWRVLRVVCFSTVLQLLNEQKRMLPCGYPSKSSIEKWSRPLSKMPIGYKTTSSCHIWPHLGKEPDRLVSIPFFNEELHGTIFHHLCNFRLFDVGE